MYLVPRGSLDFGIAISQRAFAHKLTECSAAGAVIGNYCASEYQYEMEVNTASRRVSIGCMAQPGFFLPRRYYKTLTEGAVSTSFPVHALDP